MRKICIYLCIVSSWPITILMGFFVSSGMFSIYNRISHALAVKILFVFLSGAALSWFPFSLFLATITFSFAKGNDIDDISVNGLLWGSIRKALVAPLLLGWFLGVIASVGLVFGDSTLYGIGMLFFFFAIWIMTLMIVTDAVNEASRTIEDQISSLK